VDQIGIDLDRDNFFSLFEQRLGQRALAGADFDDQRRILAGNGRDSRQNGFAREKVLAQPPPQD
jgi:hypothetical protein